MLRVFVDIVSVYVCVNNACVCIRVCVDNACAWLGVYIMLRA